MGGPELAEARVDCGLVGRMEGGNQPCKIKRSCFLKEPEKDRKGGSLLGLRQDSALSFSFALPRQARRRCGRLSCHVAWRAASIGMGRHKQYEFAAFVHS